MNRDVPITIERLHNRVASICGVTLLAHQYEWVKHNRLHLEPYSRIKILSEWQEETQ